MYVILALGIKFWSGLVVSQNIMEYQDCHLIIHQT